MKDYIQFLSLSILIFLSCCSQLYGQTIEWQDKDYPETKASIDLTAVIKNTLTEPCYVMFSQEYYVKKDSLNKTILQKLNTRYGNYKFSMFLKGQATRPAEDSINSIPETFVKRLKPKETFELMVHTTRSQGVEVQRELYKRLLIVPVSTMDKLAPNFEEAMSNNRYLYEPQRLIVFWGDLSVRFRSSRYGMEDSYEWQRRLRTPLEAIACLPDDAVVPSTDCDIEPKFPGGGSALIEYLQESIASEKNAVSDSGMPGRVTLTFVVETDGSIANIQEQKSNSGSLSKVAVRIVQEMPKWKPAQWRGKVVRSRYTLPITFMAD